MPTRPQSKWWFLATSLALLAALGFAAADLRARLMELKEKLSSEEVAVVSQQVLDKLGPVMKRMSALFRVNPELAWRLALSASLKKYT